MVGLLLVLLLFAGVAVGGEEAGGENPLAPMGWLAGGQWVAKVTPREGEPFWRESQFAWTANGRVLRFESLIRRADGSETRYQDGFYGWHPTEKKALFYSFDPAGNFYQGEVEMEGASLAHLLEGVNEAGETGRYRVVVTRNGADRYDFSLQAPEDDAWVEIVSLVYERKM